jgi:23S rRNA (uracil1939-C5)-methyltransferase
LTVAELTIDSIGAGGDGIGRTNGVVVFVPRTAPGDIIQARLEVKKRFALGRVETIVAESPVRVQPLCYHYRMDRCGGCQLQHMSYQSQLAAKQGIIRDTLTRIGKRVVDLPAIEPSGEQWRYRRKLTLALRRGGDGHWIIGLRPYDDPAAVFQLSDCPITDERVMAVWREVMEARPYFPPADELRASVRLLETGGAAIVMEGGDTWPMHQAFFDAVPSATALWWKPENRARSLIAERGASSASASFVQVNADVGRMLHDYVLDRTRAYRPRVVIDAYAGSGATAIPLAQAGIRVVAIESDPDAATQCAALLPLGSRAVAARVEEAIADALPADVVLINPPRAGIHERVASILETTVAAPRALIYVSCDPATLARDLSRMPRYKIASIRAFDMFPQTAHVETVCELVPEKT